MLARDWRPLNRPVHDRNRALARGMTTALILGAAVWPDGPSPTLKRRTLHAAQLFHAGRVQRIIPCGGLGKHPPSEAEAMRRLLVEAGVSTDRITLEDRSTTTGENIANALPLLDGDDVIVVTDWYHAPRARLVARRAGLKAASASPGLRGAAPVQQVKMALREIPAYLAYALRLRG